MKITGEAVEAAIAAFHERREGHDQWAGPNSMRAALEAALPHLSQGAGEKEGEPPTDAEAKARLAEIIAKNPEDFGPGTNPLGDTTAALPHMGGVRVKPLEWDNYSAHTPFGAYTVAEDADDLWHFTFHCYPYGTESEEGWGRKEHAKAAAQADYDRRILSAIEISASPRVVTDEMRPPFVFDRYINGRLMAEGVTIERESTLGKAAARAAKIASHGPNGETPVLVLTAALSSAGEKESEWAEDELSGIPGELIDRVAEAIRGDGGHFDEAPWESLSGERKEGWRGDARRALAVVKEYLTAPRPTSADEPRAVKPAAYIVHAPEDDYYGTGPDRLQFHPLTQYDLDNGYRQTSLIRQSDATRIITEQAEEIGRLKKELSEQEGYPGIAHDMLTLEARTEAAEADRDRIKEAATMLLSEIDAPNDINSIIDATGPLRAALGGQSNEA